MTIPTPVEISDVSLAFPADALDYMPAMTEIPEEFRKGTGEARPWREFQSSWFAFGLSRWTGYVPATIDGVQLDGEMIMRQLRAIQGSYAPKHEHKAAAVAYLASLWMTCVAYGPADCEPEDLKAIGDFPLADYIEKCRSQK